MNTTFSKLLAVGLVITSLPLANAAPADRPGGRMGRKQQQAGGAPMTQPTQPGGREGRRRQQAGNPIASDSGNNLAGRIKEIRGDFLLIEWGSADSGAATAPVAPAMGGRRRGQGRRGAGQALNAPATTPGGPKITRVRLAALRNFVRHTRGSRADLVKGARVMALASQQGGALQVKEITVNPTSAGLSESDIQSRFQAARFLSPMSPTSVAGLPIEGARLASNDFDAALSGASLQLIVARRGPRQRTGPANNMDALTRPGMPDIEVSGQLVSSSANEATIQTTDGREVKFILPSTMQPMVLRDMKREEFRVGQSVAVSWNGSGASSRGIAADGVDEIAQPAVLVLSDALGILQNSAPTESASKADRAQRKLDRANRDKLEAEIGVLMNPKTEPAGPIKGNGGEQSGGSTPDLSGLKKKY